MAKRDMASELERLREYLERNRELLRKAEIRAEEMQGLETAIDQTEESIEDRTTTSQGAQKRTVKKPCSKLKRD